MGTSGLSSPKGPGRANTSSSPLSPALNGFHRFPSHLFSLNSPSLQSENLSAYGERAFFFFPPSRIYAIILNFVVRGLFPESSYVKSTF